MELRRRWSFSGPDAWVERAAGVAGEPGRPGSPGFELRCDPPVAEQQPQTPELVVHEGVHRIEDHRPDSRRCKRLRAVRSFDRELGEHWQQERLRLAGAGTRRDRQAYSVPGCPLHCFRLVGVRRVVEQRVEAVRLHGQLAERAPEPPDPIPGRRTSGRSR